MRACALDLLGGELRLKAGGGTPLPVSAYSRIAKQPLARERSELPIFPVVAARMALWQLVPNWH